MAEAKPNANKPTLTTPRKLFTTAVEEAPPAPVRHLSEKTKAEHAAGLERLKAYQPQPPEEQ